MQQNTSEKSPAEEINGKPLPESIKKKIVELKNLETALGHLPPESWALADLQRRVNDPSFMFHSNQMEQQAELLFGDICEELSDLVCSPEEIAKVINSILKYPGGPRYCSAEEVMECLGMIEETP